MTPVFMDRFGHGNGNCLQAAVASILDLPLADVPNFSDAEGRWFAELAAWAKTREVGIVHLKPTLGVDLQYLIVDAFGVGVWEVEGTDECHALVMHFAAEYDGRCWRWRMEPVHDPNPSDTTPPLLICREIVLFIPRGIFGSK